MGVLWVKVSGIVVFEKAFERDMEVELGFLMVIAMS